MTFYQELQLSQAGSKNYISEFKKPKDKFVHILIFILKVLLNLIFCTGVILLLSMIFGNENSIAGLVVLLAVMAYRFTNLDIRTSHSVGGIFIIFLIFALGPKAANLVPAGCDFCINFVCILFIVIIGCHNAKLFNHCTLILSYVLLFGSDVDGFSYVKRLLCLLLGAVLSAAIFYRNNRKKTYDLGFKNLFTDFRLSDARTRWQIKIALCVSGAMLFSSLLGFTKPVWAGIAAMSVTAPFGEIKTRVESRIRGNIIATCIFIALYLILPQTFLSYFGVLGGLCAGFCGRYEGQTAWNSFSAMSIATMSFGAPVTVIYRVLNNIFGALFAFLLGKIIEEVLLAIDGLISKRKKLK